MIKGFSVLEVLITLSLSCLALTIVISNITGAVGYSKKITNNQQKMEAIFHTVETIRSDLTKCGQRVRIASENCGFNMFENSEQSFKVLYGVKDESLTGNCWSGETKIPMERSAYFTRKKKILLFDSEKKTYEFNKIKDLENEHVVLTEKLQNDYSKNSLAIVLNEVEYKIYSKQRTLKRKVNNGYFQPLIDNVTDFYVQFFPEASSVLYRIEINEQEQVRGYVFLTNTVGK